MFSGFYIFFLFLFLSPSFILPYWVIFANAYAFTTLSLTLS